MPVDNTLFAQAKCFGCPGAGMTEMAEFTMWLRYLAKVDENIVVTPESLDEAGKCYLCYAPMTPFQARKMALMAAIAQALNGNADVTPQALMRQTACVACLGAPLPDLIEIGLLQLIYENA